MLQPVAQLPGGLLAGITYPLRAIVLLARTPALLLGVVLPILVNVVIGIALYAVLLFPGWQTINAWSSGLPGWSGQWLATLPNWLQRGLVWLPAGAAAIDDIFRWLLAIALLITIGLLLVQFGAILGAPFYGNLAEQVEKQQMGHIPGTPSFSRALQDIWRAITFQIKKLLVMVVGAVLLLVIGLTPGGAAIASIGWIILGAVLVCLDFLDPPLERRHLSFRRKIAILFRTFPASASFGWACLVMVSIPLLNLLVVPVCVIAGTLYCCDRVLPHLSDTSAQKS